MALLCAAEAVKDSRWHAADFVVVVPSQFLASLDDAAREEGDPREAQVMRVNKDALSKHVGFARMLKEMKTRLFEKNWS